MMMQYVAYMINSKTAFYWLTRIVFLSVHHSIPIMTGRASVLYCTYIITHWPMDRNGRYSADAILKYIFWKKSFRTLYLISLKFISYGPIGNISTFVQGNDLAPTVAKSLPWTNADPSFNELKTDNVDIPTRCADFSDFYLKCDNIVLPPWAASYNPVTGLWLTKPSDLNSDRRTAKVGGLPVILGVYS